MKEMIILAPSSSKRVVESSCFKNDASASPTAPRRPDMSTIIYIHILLPIYILKKEGKNEIKERDRQKRTKIERRRETKCNFCVYIIHTMNIYIPIPFF